MSCRDCLGCGLNVDAQGRMFVEVEPAGGVLCDPVAGLHMNVDGTTLVEDGGVLRSPVPRVEWITTMQGTAFPAGSSPAHSEYAYTQNATVAAGFGASLVDTSGFAAGLALASPFTGQWRCPASLAGLYDIAVGFLFPGSAQLVANVDSGVGLRITDTMAVGKMVNTGRPGGSNSTSVRDHVSYVAHGLTYAHARFSQVLVNANDYVAVSAWTEAPVNLLVAFRKVGV